MIDPVLVSSMNDRYPGRFKHLPYPPFPLDEAFASEPLLGQQLSQIALR